MNLYPDQIQLIADTRAAMRDSKAVLMRAETGFGKTVCVSSMFQTAVKKNKRAMMVVPRLELLSQTSNNFTNFNIEHGFISGDYDYEINKPAYVATMQSLANQIDNAPDLDFLALDEVHHGANALDKIIKHYKARGTYIIGLSATPKKNSGKGLGCWFDKMVHGPDTAWLIKNKRLSEYRMFAPDRPDYSSIPKIMGDYHQGKLSEKMEQDRVLIGNQILHYKNHAMGKINITFGVGRKHAQILNQAFNDGGVPSAYVDGETPVHERKRIFQALGRRELLNVCNSDLLTYGFDLSLAAEMDVTVESISIGRATKSIALWRQILGRVLRYKPYPALIFDHSSTCFELGLPDTPIEWSLDDKPIKMRQNDDIALARCESCYALMFGTRTCPECGVVRELTPREIKQRAGKLREVQEIALKKQQRQEVGKAATLMDLQRIAQERGYDPKWAWIRAKIKGLV